MSHETHHSIKIMKTFLRFVVAALFLFGLLLMPSLFAANGSQTNVTIEVLIFSGRPNPTWQLQDTNLLQILKPKLRDLPVVFEQEPAEWSRLGFGGFLIRGGASLGLPAEIRIFQGVIKTGQGKSARFRKDTKGLEALLIAETGKQTLPAPVKETIKKYDDLRKSAR